MEQWDDRERDYNEPGWWTSLTPFGQIVVASLATIVLILLMILVGTIESL